MKRATMDILIGFLMISALSSFRPISAAERIGGPAALAPRDITRDRSLQNTPDIEASGLAYLSIPDRYVLISDETEGDRPVVYLMNRQGHVEQAVAISGLDRITDMEAICNGENGEIYILCSQSPNKKGKIPDHRKLLIRVAVEGTDFHLKNKIGLHDLLQDALMNSCDPHLASIRLAGGGMPDLDIEGMFFREGAIFLGLKTPVNNLGEAVILRIGDILRVFAENRIEPGGLTAWRLLDLKDRSTGLPTGISDLCLHENTLWILSYARIEKNSPLRTSGMKKLGILWTYDLKSGRLSPVTTFQNMQPEGAAVRTDHETAIAVTIVFDGGGSASSQWGEIKPDGP